jgi:hypothetical protein
LELKVPAFVTTPSAVTKTYTRQREKQKGVIFIKTTRLYIPDVFTNEKFPNGLRSKMTRIAAFFCKQDLVFFWFIQS